MVFKPPGMFVDVWVWHICSPGVPVARGQQPLQTFMRLSSSQQLLPPCPTLHSQPAAVRCPRPALPSSCRQAREYLYWRVHGRQATTPVAIMTSAAKGNHWRVEAAFEAAGWFGRGRDAFR